MKKMASNSTPFDPDRYIGTITVVTPNSVKANFPRAVSTPDNRRAIRGNVGDFVFIECDEYAVFGRITEISLPDRERLAIEPGLGKDVQAHPIGSIQLLASMEIANQRTVRGVPAYPKIADRIFIAHPELIKKMTADRDTKALLKFALGNVTVATEAGVSITPEALFGRHCGILGATGGGKSWTLARLLEAIHGVGGKAILFDATGEFSSLPYIDAHLAMGEASNPNETAVAFPYTRFTEGDLFALFTPSGQSQGPKLREAIKAQKLVRAIGTAQAPTGLLIRDGCVVKADRAKAPFFAALRTYSAQVNHPLCDFDIALLTAQIANECIWPSTQNNTNNWGGVNNSDLGYCATLLVRIEQRVNAPELKCLFATDLPNLTDKISEFLSNPDSKILRISMENLSFQYNARELVANSIGRYLLSEARLNKFKDMPLVCFLDEAHQFLEKTIGDEFGSVRLDAFGLIAKEGRKYGLTCVFATQRPRDIPEDVLSQLGALIVHRLTNDKDRSVVERACGDIDKSAAAFLPMLDQGEALIVGTDFPIPVPLKIATPSKGPNSMGPQYQKHWGKKPPANNASAVETTSGDNISLENKTDTLPKTGTKD